MFPDGTEPKWESVDWLQRRFMKWFNVERTRKDLTFPVETMNLLNNGKDCVDEAYKDFVAEMYAEGHSFFTYTSDSVDSLASCCFDGKQKVLVKHNDGVIELISLKELHNKKCNDKKNLTVYHNGSWVLTKTIKLPKRPLYKVTTVNNKEILVTDNHINPTSDGDKYTSELTTEDYLMFSNMTLDTYPEKDLKLTYAQGYLLGMYLGDGSVYVKKDSNSGGVFLSLNEEKYKKSYSIIKKAIEDCGIDCNIVLGKPNNNVYPVSLYSMDMVSFIRKYISGSYCYEKELSLDVLSQDRRFRKGILDGYYLTDGGNSNRIYSTSEKLIEQMECLITTLGMHTIINVTDRTDEKVVIRGEEFNRNFPLYCIRWYEPKNKRNVKDVFKVRNNSTYFKIKSIEPYEVDDDSVYCFEVTKDEPYFTLPNGIITHNCRLKNMITDNTFSYTLGAGGVATGSKGVMTMNLNRLVQIATKKGIDISDMMREQTLKMHKYLLAYNEIVKENFEAGLLPVYSAGYISLEKQYLTLGVNGFVEAAESLGIKISPNDEYFEFGEKILKPIYEENKKARTKEVMFNTEFVPAENLGVKNAKWDKTDGYKVGRDCYNSYFYKVEDETCSVLDKFILHGSKLTKYLDGGSALHCNLEEHLTKEQYLKLIVVAIKTGCSYFTFNIPNTICNKCGYINKNNLDHCVKCGSEDVDYLTRIIGYIKRISKWSNERMKEAKKRFYGKL